MKKFSDFLNTGIEEILPKIVESEEVIEELKATDEPLFEGDFGPNMHTLAAKDNTKQNHHHQADPPAVLVMRRITVRQFPNGQRVALYFVKAVNKYVTVPYTSMQWSASMPEEFNSGIEQLTNSNTIYHLDGSVSNVNEDTTNMLLSVYGALTEDNKQKFNEMISKSEYHFKKATTFAQKHLK